MGGKEKGILALISIAVYIVVGVIITLFDHKKSKEPYDENDFTESIPLPSRLWIFMFNIHLGILLFFIVQHPMTAQQCIGFVILFVIMLSLAIYLWITLSVVITVKDDVIIIKKVFSNEMRFLAEEITCIKAQRGSKGGICYVVYSGNKRIVSIPDEFQRFIKKMKQYKHIQFI